MKNYNSLAVILFAALFSSCGSNDEGKEIAAAPAEPKKAMNAPHKKHEAEIPAPKPETHVKLTKTEDKLLDEILKLPEVKNLSDKIERESNGKHHLVSRISSKPSDDQEYYGISISEDNGEALATYFEFRIYPDHSIYYYDAVEDREMDLKEWRAQKK